MRYLSVLVSVLYLLSATMVDGKNNFTVGRMPDSQSSEPGFESPFATVSKIGHFRSLH